MPEKVKLILNFMLNDVKLNSKQLHFVELMIGCDRDFTVL